MIKLKKIYIQFPLFFAAFFLLAYLSAMQMLQLPYIPNTANQDLARHVALALNFRDAIFDGQSIPRLQLSSVHGIQDIPVFQYYGFLSSLLAQPGLLFDLSPLNSLILGVVIARWIGCLAIIGVCRRQSLCWHSGLIAVLVWLFFPYIQSNLYGRIAIPEAIAQGLLPLIPLAWAMANGGSSRVAAILTSLSVFLLALAHPIFLMWGVVNIFLFMVISCFMGRYSHARDMLCGTIAGLGLSSFQWLPSLITKKDFATPFLEVNPFTNAYLTSYSGFYGLPEALPSSLAHNLFLTVSVWFLPAILSIILFYKRIVDLSSYLVPFVFLLFIYLFLAYSPLDIWSYLPKIFWGTQFPYRMLSFVALYGSIILAYSFSLIRVSNSRIPLVILSGIFLVLLSGRSLLYVPFDGSYIEGSIDVKSEFGSLDYVVTNQSSYLYGDKWLIKDNKIVMPNISSDKNLYLVARSGLSEGSSISLSIVDYDTKISLKKVYVGSADSAFNVEIPAYVNAISIVPDNFFRPSNISASSDDRELSVSISHLEIGPVQSAIINPSDLNRFVIGPYDRKYVIKTEKVEKLAKGAPLKIILPVAYSRLWIASQNNNVVDLTPTHNGFAAFESNDMSPITLSYKTPIMVIICFALGLAMLFLIIFYKKFFRMK